MENKSAATRDPTHVSLKLMAYVWFVMKKVDALRRSSFAIYSTTKQT